MKITLLFAALGLGLGSSVAMAQSDAPEVVSPAVEPAITPRNDPPPDTWVGKPKHDMFWSFGLGGGLTFWTESSPFGTNTAIGTALPPGYNLQLRTSFEFLPWLALDLRGLNTHNAGNSIVQGGKITGWGGLAAARFTLPLKHIKPYALVGFGRHHYNASGADTLLLSGSYNAIEAGVGAIVPLDNNFEVGFEWLYNHLINETISSNPKADGGDPTTMSLFVQYHLPI